MTTLSHENIEIVENFINTHSAGKLPHLSECDRPAAISEYKKITDQTTIATSYYKFGSDANGYTSYGYYKSKDDKIYIISAFMGNVTAYYNVDSDWYFLKPYEY